MRKPGMTILIPYQIGSVGGPNTFIEALAEHLKSRGYLIIYHSRLRFDTSLVLAECPLWLVLYAKLRGSKIIQRLDGVYHPGLPGANRYLYPLKNLRMKIIHNYLANQVIYQSKFAKRSCEVMLGKPRGETSIIYNGVDTTEQRQKKRAGAKAALQLTTAANFRRRDQIEPIIAALTYISTPYHLHVYGPYTQNLAQLFSSLNNNPRITCHGATEHSELLEALSKQDIFLFSDQSACPNVVLEAMATSLPVVAFDRGSVRELVEPGQGGEIVPLLSHNPFRDSYPFTEQSYSRLARAISRVADNLTSYKSAALHRAKTKYDITTMLESYEAIL